MTRQLRRCDQRFAVLVDFLDSIDDVVHVLFRPQQHVL